MVRIRFTSLLADRIGGINSVEVAATSVRAALRALTDKYPKVARLVWSEENVVNPMMAIFLNNQLLDAGHLDVAVNTGDQIEIIPAVSGGL
jgi:molybdopterin converting factor small subunit